MSFEGQTKILWDACKNYSRRRTMDKVMVGVRDYEEGMEVTLTYENDRPVILAMNEAGHCCTRVDLIELLEWVKVNMPELMPSSCRQHPEPAPHG